LREKEMAMQLKLKELEARPATHVIPCVEKSTDFDISKQISYKVSSCISGNGNR